VVACAPFAVSGVSLCCACTCSGARVLLCHRCIHGFQQCHDVSLIGWARTLVKADESLLDVRCIDLVDADNAVPAALAQIEAQCSFVVGSEPALVRQDLVRLRFALLTIVNQLAARCLPMIDWDIVSHAWSLAGLLKRLGYMIFPSTKVSSSWCWWLLLVVVVVVVAVVVVVVVVRSKAVMIGQQQTVSADAL
jgi:hypothetical protein